MDPKILSHFSSSDFRVSNIEGMIAPEYLRRLLRERYFSRKQSARYLPSRRKSKQGVRKMMPISLVSHILAGRRMVVSQKPIRIHIFRVICDFSSCIMVSSRTIIFSERLSRRKAMYSTRRRIQKSSRSSSRICMMGICARHLRLSSRILSEHMHSS